MHPYLKPARHEGSIPRILAHFTISAQLLFSCTEGKPHSQPMQSHTPHMAKAPPEPNGVQTPDSDYATETDVRPFLDALIHRQYPRLRGYWSNGRIHVETFSEYPRLFAARPSVVNSVRSAKVHYTVYYDPRNFQWMNGHPPMSKKALWGVLAHELAHIQEYVGQPISSLVRAGKAYVRNGHSLARYERSTDVRALVHAHRYRTHNALVHENVAEGLVAFRHWVDAPERNQNKRGKTHEKKRQLRRERYLFQEEITVIDRLIQGYPELWKRLIGDPPMNLKEAQALAQRAKQRDESPTTE